LDTYKLLTLRRILTAMGAGCVAAAIAFPLNTLAFTAWGTIHAHWTAPILEELLKAVYPVWCIRRSRIGFPVDAAIIGFAVGAGFSLAENIVYMHAIEGTVLLWLIRGFGTAMMHGAATAIVAILAVTLSERRGLGIALVPGLLLAFAIHIFFNSGLLPPATTTQVILVLLPLLLAFVFSRSERMLAGWLAAKLDQDIEVLTMIDSGEFFDSAAGRYLQSLCNSFPPQMVGDMLCLLRLSLELSAQAKGILLRAQFGFPPEADPSVPGKLKEMAYLEKSLGRAGRLAVAPLLRVRSRDLWEMHRLAEESE
jgi:hypothetical protein